MTSGSRPGPKPSAGPNCGGDLPRGWLSMWIVNTEIAGILKGADTADSGISNLTGHEIHFFKPLFQLVEGANQENPLAQTGWTLYGGANNWLGGSQGLLDSTPPNTAELWAFSAAWWAT